MKKKATANDSYKSKVNSLKSILKKEAKYAVGGKSKVVAKSSSNESSQEGSDRKSNTSESSFSVAKTVKSMVSNIHENAKLHQCKNMVSSYT